MEPSSLLSSGARRAPRAGQAAELRGEEGGPVLCSLEPTVVWLLLVPSAWQPLCGAYRDAPPSTPGCSLGRAPGSVPTSCSGAGRPEGLGGKWRWKCCDPLATRSFVRGVRCTAGGCLPLGESPVLLGLLRSPVLGNLLSCFCSGEGCR